MRSRQFARYNPKGCMPAPGNATEFLSVVEKSGLLEADELDSYRFRSSADPSPPDRIAKWMLVDGRLTAFQVELLLAGKSRPFFVGPYKVLSRIGNGSMGVIYLCEHRGMRKQVAVKVLQNRRVQDEVALERFVREARAAAALNHPNVIHALDFGCEGQLHYLAMEYIDGVSLKELILKKGPLPPLKAADYLRQAALGVQHAHEAGLIHRDIKPSNLMIDNSEVVKLLDLGLARFGEGDIDITRGAPLGSLAYSAPEQALDSHAVDARADIYSLGAVFYLALTGRLPTPGVGIGDANPHSSSDPENFSRLMTMLRRMTAHAPCDRYQSAAEVAAELSRWITPNAPIAVPVLSMDSDSDVLLALPVSDTVATASTVSEADELHAVPVLEPVATPTTEPEAAETADFDLADLAREETAQEPAFAAFVAEPPPSAKLPSSKLPSSKPPSQQRTYSRPALQAKSKNRMEWRQVKQWFIKWWQPLVLVLAVVVGLSAAVANRENSPAIKYQQTEQPTQPSNSDTRGGFKYYKTSR